MRYTYIVVTDGRVLLAHSLPTTIIITSDRFVEQVRARLILSVRAKVGEERPKHFQFRVGSV